MELKEMTTNDLIRLLSVTNVTEELYSDIYHELVERGVFYV